MTATLVFNADLGNYSDALGSAQRLSNGDYSFDSGRQGPAPNQIGQAIEVRPDGSKAYVLQVNKPVYRAFRIQTLYEGVSDQLAGDDQETCDHGDRPDGNGGAADPAAPADGTTRSDPVTEPPALQGLDVALTRLVPTEPRRTASPVFALNFGESFPETTHAWSGPMRAAGQIPPEPVSPVFFDPADGTPTTPAGATGMPSIRSSPASGTTRTTCLDVLNRYEKRPAGFSTKARRR